MVLLVQGQMASQAMGSPQPLWSCLLVHLFPEFLLTAQVCCLALGCFGKQCAVNITFDCLGLEQCLNSGSGMEGRTQREDSQPSVCALGRVFATQKSAQFLSFLSSFPCFAPCIYIAASSLMHILISKFYVLIA